MDKFRIVQIIDSLDAGGAERMAVSYANALSDKIELSAIIASRSEGGLKQFISPKVKYTCLFKKNTIDFKAIYKLLKFVNTNKISHIHAHSSSFFYACIIKILKPKIKIIWHDHYGNSEFLNERKNSGLLKIGSFLFDKIIAVNFKLESWTLKNLHCKNVKYIPNFITKTNVNLDAIDKTILKGDDTKRIICLANLRPQKNHELLIDVALKIKDLAPDWSFHIVGKDFKDDYSNNLLKKIEDLNLQYHVFVYGAKTDVDFILSQAEIGILTSKSEGLPVSLLEYGLSKLAVVSTSVGEIPTVISDDTLGTLVPPNDPKLFAEALFKVIDSIEFRNNLKDNFNNHILENFEEFNIIQKYLYWLKTE